MFLLGHPTTKVKGLKCPSPFAYKKQEWLICKSRWSCTVFVLLLSFFFLHFLHHCGSSSSSSLCHFTLLVLLLLPSWVLVLCLWFFLLVAPDPLLLALLYLFFMHCVATPSLLLLFLSCCCLKQCQRQKWHFSEKITYKSSIHMTANPYGFFLLNIFFLQSFVIHYYYIYFSLQPYNYTQT